MLVPCSSYKRMYTRAVKRFTALGMDKKAAGFLVRKLIRCARQYRTDKKDFETVIIALGNAFGRGWVEDVELKTIADRMPALVQVLKRPYKNSWRNLLRSAEKKKVKADALVQSILVGIE